MADAYIDSAYVTDHLGSAFTNAAQVAGVDLTVKIEGATSLIQGYMRQAGYPTPSTTDPTEVEEAVKLAVFGALVVMLQSTPEVSVNLPDNWAEHPARVAYLGILNGELQLAAAVDKSAAFGGFKWSDGTSSAGTVRTRRVTRKEFGSF